MKRKILFIILCVTTLTFTGCGKEETPVINNNVETEVETEKETEPIVENEPITELEIETITRDEIAETTTETDTTIEVDINGVDGTVEEVKETTENDPDAADPSLTPEDLEMIENMFSGEGSFGGQEPTYTGSFNNGKGLEYYGDDQPW